MKLSEEEIINYFNIYIKVTEKQIENKELWLIEDSEKEHIKFIKRLIRFIQKRKRNITFFTKSTGYRKCQNN